MKRIFFLAVLLTLVSALLAGCDLNQVISIDTPVPGSRPAVTPVPLVPTAEPGVPATGGGTINLPGARINILAPGPNPMMDRPANGGAVAGILLGLWHGIISPITLIMSFLNPAVQMYEVHNDGAPYNLGFLLGIVILVGVLGFLRR